MACQMISRPLVLRNLLPVGMTGRVRVGPQPEKHLCACRAVFSATLLSRIPHSSSYYQIMTFIVPVVVSSTAAASGGRPRHRVQAGPASQPMRHP